MCVWCRQLSLRRAALTAKVARVRALMEEVGLGANLHAMRPTPTPTPSPAASSKGLSDSARPPADASAALPQKVEMTGAEQEAALYALALGLWRALAPMEEMRRSRLLTGATDALTPVRPALGEGRPSATTTPTSSSSSSTAGGAEPSVYSLYGGVAAASDPATGTVASSSGGGGGKEANRAAPATLEGLLRDGRWGVCGFPSMPAPATSPTTTATAATPASLTSSGPLKDFHGNGLLALRCLTGFLRRYPVAGSKLGVEFAQHRARFCTLPQVAVWLAR